jgi:predicted alpha/beta-hydrolase family hydrolase
MSRSPGQRVRAALTVALLAAAPQAGAAGEEVRSTPTRKGVTQSFLLVQPPGPPTASIILFPGGDGRLALSPPDTIGQARSNFLVRTRGRFARAGFLVAVVDTPSDRVDEWNFRSSKEQAEDMKQVIAALRAMAAVPVWVVGTSMGTISAANVAARLTEGGPDRLVLTSSVTVTTPKIGESVKTVRLGDIHVPTLLVRHKDDTRKSSPPSDAPSVLKGLTQANPKQLLTFEGGGPPKSEPCEALAFHGYIGIEAQVVDAIIEWIRTPHAG